MALSSMITLPPSPAKGFYSCWNPYSRVASPTTSTSHSPPASPPSSPSLMFTLPASSVNGFYSSWQRYTDVSTPSGSGSLPSRTSRPSSPLPTISERFDKRSSWPVRPRPPLPLLDLQNSGSDSRPTSLTSSVSYSYTVKSINSRKSRLKVLYPRPVRPPRLSGVESIPESAGASLESLVPLSSRSVSMSTSLQGYSPPVADKEASLSKLWPAVTTLYLQYIL